MQNVLAKWQLNQQQLKAFLLLSAPALVAGLYVLSVCWRVSVAEFEQFGRSTLLPVTFSQHKYDEPSTAESYGANTYTHTRADGTKVRVYKQLINGFQHTYGSALADYEIGNTLADFLFRANEYAESYVFCRDTDTYEYHLDTRKDLANNAIGRSIAKKARKSKLNGADAYAYILSESVKAVDSNLTLPHFKSPRVAQLPSAAEMGCPGLR